ncbi:MAG: FAD-dependent oxidoreductase [Chlamydiales bacterium]|nr:FAD-dependent oxidoreductase [Chlamydiales bacterium]
MAVAPPTVTKTYAIIGAGYAGLATAWHLLQQNASVTLFDHTPLGMGTSGIAAGLLHTYMGIDAKLALHGPEAYQATLKLLNIASQALEKPVYQRKGILRVALNPRQQTSFHQCSLDYDDVTWNTAEQTQSLVSGIVSAPSILISSGIQVDGNAYLLGLWTACERLGARFVAHNVESLDELAHFDHIFVTSGADKRLTPHLPVTQVRGQILQLKWPEGHPPLPFPVNSHVYCVMHAENHSCFVGATYERGVDSVDAYKELLPKITKLLPFLANAEAIDVKTGVRASTPGHLPLYERISERVTAFTGLGSKGLLYHSVGPFFAPSPS